jgi:ferredoxin
MEVNPFYQHLKIYVFSGTGNSWQVATWLANVAREKNCKVKVVSLRLPLKSETVVDRSDSLLGVVFPTHALTTPWIVWRFICQLPKVRNANAFCIATQGAVHLGKFQIPGFSGNAGFLAALLLRLRGYRIRNVGAVNMPANWTAAHSGQSAVVISRIINRAKVDTEALANTLLERKSRLWRTRNILTCMFGFTFFPISLAYLLVGRFFLAKIFFASERCTACGSCAKACPLNAIQMHGHNLIRPFWTWRCQSCMRCMAYCPEQAIEASQIWAVLLICIAHGPLANWLPALGLIPMLNTPLEFAFWILSSLAIVFGAYYLFYPMSRIPLVNRFLRVTTLTRIYRRYHAPKVGIEDLMETT